MYLVSSCLVNEPHVLLDKLLDRSVCNWRPSWPRVSTNRSHFPVFSQELPHTSPACLHPINPSQQLGNGGALVALIKVKQNSLLFVSTEHHRYFLVNQATCQDNWTLIEWRLSFRTVPTIWFTRSKYGNETETIQL